MDFSEISCDMQKRLREPSKATKLEDEINYLHQRLDSYNITIKAILEEIQQSKMRLKREQGNMIIAPLPITIADEHYNLLENKEFFITKEQEDFNPFLREGIV